MSVTLTLDKLICFVMVLWFIILFVFQKMICLDPSKRITARTALGHEYFRDVAVAPWAWYSFFQHGQSCIFWSKIVHSLTVAYLYLVVLDVFFFDSFAPLLDMVQICFLFLFVSLYIRNISVKNRSLLSFPALDISWNLKYLIVRSRTFRIGCNQNPLFSTKYLLFFVMEESIDNGLTAICTRFLFFSSSS